MGRSLAEVMRWLTSYDLAQSTRKMDAPLYDLLFGAEIATDELLDRFLDCVARLGFTLYPAQEDAIFKLFAKKKESFPIHPWLGRVAPGFRPPFVSPHKDELLFRHEGAA